MARATPGRIAAAVVLVVVLVGALRWFVPFLATDRAVITSSPSLSGVFSSNEVKVAPKSRLCVAPVPFEPDSRIVRLSVTSGGRPAPLVVRATGPGYDAQTTLQRYATGMDVAVSAALGPPRRPVTGSLCVVNGGRSAISLTGTQEPRSLSFAQTTVDGKVLPAQGIAVSFFAARPSSLLNRAGAVGDHASALAGGLLPTWMLWMLAVVFVIGVPLLAAGVFLLPSRLEDT